MCLASLMPPQPNGVEELCSILNAFFTILVRTVHRFNGDIVKVWQASPMPCGGSRMPLVCRRCRLDRVAHQQFAGCCARPVPGHAACSGMLHCPAQGKPCPNGRTLFLLWGSCPVSSAWWGHLIAVQALDNYPATAEVKLRLHMGIGCGMLTNIHVVRCPTRCGLSHIHTQGGVFNRWEYVVAGPPIGQIAVAEPLAMPGETVMSPESYLHVQGLVECTPLEELKDDTTRKAKIDSSHYTYMRVEALLVDPIQPAPIHHVRFQTRHVALLRRFGHVTDPPCHLTRGKIHPGCHHSVLARWAHGACRAARDFRALCQVLRPQHLRRREARLQCGWCVCDVQGVCLSGGRRWRRGST